MKPDLGRDLAAGELNDLVAALAAKPERWRPHVRHRREERVYVQLHRDPHLDLWLICWDAFQATGLHDHDRSSGAVQVVEGALLEDFFVAQPDGSISLQTTRHEAGARFSFDATYIHDVRHDGGTPAVSLHAYSPALWRMGHYAIGLRGLGRTSLTYVEELESVR